MASGNNTNSVTITDTLRRIRDFLSCRFGMKNGLAVLIRAPLLDKFTRRRRGGAEIEEVAHTTAGGVRAILCLMHLQPPPGVHSLTPTSRLLCLGKLF